MGNSISKQGVAHILTLQPSDHKMEIDVLDQRDSFLEWKAFLIGRLEIA